MTPNPYRTNMELYYFFNGDVEDKKNEGEKFNGTLENFDTSSCYAISTAPMFNNSDFTTFGNDSKASFYSFESVQPRQQIQQIAMTNPIRITYKWGKENRLQVSTTTTKASNLPIIEVLDANGNVDPEKTRKGSGEFWFNHNSPLKVTSSESNSYDFTGYTNGLGNVIPMERTFGEEETKEIRFDLSEGSTITLKYGQTILPLTVNIGDPVSYSGDKEPYATHEDGTSQVEWKTKPTITVVESPARVHHGRHDGLGRRR